MKKKPWSLALIAASALAALAVGVGAQSASDRRTQDPIYAAGSLPDLR